MKKLFFVVGEDSGDAIAAKLIRELKKTYGDDIECLGIGGPLMENEGFKILLPMDQISVIGIWEVIPRIPDLLKIFKALKSEIIKQKPDALITVDFPDFSFFLHKALKKTGAFKGKHIHYVSPSVWAWRESRAKYMAKFLDGVICLFQMEPPYYLKHGLKAVAVGHPLVESRIEQGDGKKFREENEIPENTKTLGLFFGSRDSEFNNLATTLRETAMLVNDVEKEKVHIIVPTLPKTEFQIQNKLLGFKLPIYITANPATKWDAFKACDVAVAVSGTVGLELAYAGVPHVITYKINPITYFIVRLLAKVKHVHLANILLGREVVPEYLQRKCNSLEIASEITKLLHNAERQNIQKEAFKELRKHLGGDEEKTPSAKAVEFIQAIVKP